MTVTGYSPHDENAVFLDPRHAYTRVEGPTPLDPQEGIVEHHLLADGQWCSGFVKFAQGPERAAGEWTVESPNPLTLWPSIKCPDCGNHGYIEGGRWRSV